MIEKKAITFLFMLLFAFSSLSSTIAVPSSRSFKFITHENISTQQLLRDEIQKEGRMDVEVTDYSGTGANNHHDPKSPPGSF